MKEAIKKLEKFFPELLEVKEGSAILTPHWNMFSQKYEEGVFDEYLVRDGKVIEEFCDDNPICYIEDIKHHFSDYKVQNTILLNHIIMYIQTKEVTINSCTDPNLLFFGTILYNLTKPFEEQSELFYELINKIF